MPLVLDAAYLLFLAVVGPFFWLARRLRKKRTLPLGPRCGGFDPPPPVAGQTVWVHAVSVGEVLAARDLIARLREGLPGGRVVLTTTTAAGYDVARKTYPDLFVTPSPLDFSWAVRRFFARLAPAALVLVELELWPNLLGAAGRRGVPVFVANARVSERSAGRYRLLTRLWPSFLRPIRKFLAQGPEHAVRLADLGVGPERIVIAGNLKFDNAVPLEPEPLRTELRALLGFAPTDPVLVAGSTHRGEDEIVVRAFLEVRRRIPQAKLLLAPRHSERLIEVTALLSSLHLSAVRRSAAPFPAGSPCVVLDTTGELGRFYAVADAAFVGGTLVPVGGHNLLEPAAYGTPIVVGPHLKSVRDTARLFAEAGALVEVRDGAALAACVEDWFKAPEASRARGATARGLIESRRGAAARCAAEVLAELRRERRGSG